MTATVPQPSQLEPSHCHPPLSPTVTFPLPFLAGRSHLPKPPPSHLSIVEHRPLPISVFHSPCSRRCHSPPSLLLATPSRAPPCRDTTVVMPRRHRRRDEMPPPPCRYATTTVPEPPRCSHLPIMLAPPLRALRRRPSHPRHETPFNPPPAISLVSTLSGHLPHAAGCHPRLPHAVAASFPPPSYRCPMELPSSPPYQPAATIHHCRRHGLTPSPSHCRSRAAASRVDAPPSLSPEMPSHSRAAASLLPVHRFSSRVPPFSSHLHHKP